MSDDKAHDWIVAFNKYTSVCNFGGTKEERTGAWARANKALDKLMVHERAEQRRRSKRDTIEVPAIPFPGRST